MSKGRLSADDWAAYAESTEKATRGKSREEIFTSREMDDYFDPKSHTMRESCDSDEYPESRPLILALDVSGSMGMIADALARKGLGTLCKEIYKRKPIKDPHILAMAVGDSYFDSSPLQITQFEADERIVEQLTKLHLEGGGGPNGGESYSLAWYYAAYHTEIDSLKKRGRKGLLFTFGDEPILPTIPKAHIKKIFGDDVQQNINTRDLLAIVQQKYDVYHVIIKEGSYARSRIESVRDSWRPLLGQNVIELSDHKKVAEVVVSIIQTNEGVSELEAAKGWDGTTAVAVREALESRAIATRPKHGAIVRMGKTTHMAPAA
jgi:hypothetical protein